ncbi:tail assembly protein [Salmonella enterica]|nr:tail assembly protein [Salmonella enterica]EFV3714508.1 tail assembly protein [Salmonella enterica]EMD3045820.1 tail assembly protein [Salmonella enterica]EMD3054565.1 tail assembly protein [Salmonella enterica]EMD3408691.1 tail assembly protein [Salmonella enterica]
MATTDTFDMAAPAMVRICLYGDLQRFGKRFSLSIKTAAEGIQALAVQLPGFRQKLNDGWYQVRIAGEDVSEQTLSARLHEPLATGSVIHIVPRLAGAKSGWAGVLLGAALIGASFIPGLNAAVWAGATTTWSSLAFSFGATMMLGGVAQLLTPQPKSPSMHSADNGRQSTYFSSLENMVAQGNPVPLAYGEVMTGSRRISQEIATRDESSPDKIISFGRADRFLEHVIKEHAPGIYRPRVIVR